MPLHPLKSVKLKDLTAGSNSSSLERKNKSTLSVIDTNNVLSFTEQSTLKSRSVHPLFCRKISRPFLGQINPNLQPPWKSSKTLLI